MASLSDKLRAMGVKLGARDLPPPRSRTRYPIEQVVAGRIKETLFGDIYVVEQRYPTDLNHGSGTLGLVAPLCATARWANEERLADVGAENLAFLDTETTGLAGGTGTYAFMVGVARFDGAPTCANASFHLAQFFMRDPAEETALLAALTEFLAPCQALVTFNGKGFDVPLLTARYIASRLASDRTASPLHAMVHLDLLQLARWLWRDRLSSRALGSLEEHILGVSRTEQDVPSWMIPELYFDFLRTGDARPLKNIFYHNAMDVLSMAALLNHIACLLDDPLCADARGMDLVAIGRRFEVLGQTDTARQLYRRGIAASILNRERGRTIERLSFIQKRSGDLPSAVELWRQAAQDGEVYACVELAKFYEHKARDYGEAARWAQEAIDRVSRPDAHHFGLNPSLADLQYRMARLRRKLTKTLDTQPEKENT
jgi:uncharacterized protein